MQVNGQKKLERMRDGRVVYVGAERIEDVAAKNLDRHRASMAQILGAIHVRHTAPAKQAAELEAAVEHRQFGSA